MAIGFKDLYYTNMTVIGNDINGFKMIGANHNDGLLPADSVPHLPYLTGSAAQTVNPTAAGGTGRCVGGIWPGINTGMRFEGRSDPIYAQGSATGQNMNKLDFGMIGAWRVKESGGEGKYYFVNGGGTPTQTDLNDTTLNPVDSDTWGTGDGAQGSVGGDAYATGKHQMIGWDGTIDLGYGSDAPDWDTNYTLFHKYYGFGSLNYTHWPSHGGYIWPAWGSYRDFGAHEGPFSARIWVKNIDTAATTAVLKISGVSRAGAVWHPPDYNGNYDLANSVEVDINKSTGISSNAPGEALDYDNASSVRIVHPIAATDTDWQELSVQFQRNNPYQNTGVTMQYGVSGTGTKSLRFASPGLWPRDMMMQNVASYAWTYWNGGWGNGNYKGFWIGHCSDSYYNVGTDPEIPGDSYWTCEDEQYGIIGTWNNYVDYWGSRYYLNTTFNCTGFPTTSGAGTQADPAGTLDCWLFARIKITHVSYHPTSFEVTYIDVNNAKGFHVYFDDPEFVNHGKGWRKGINYVRVKIAKKYEHNLSLAYYDDTGNGTTTWNYTHGYSFGRVQVYGEVGNASAKVKIEDIRIFPNNINAQDIFGQQNRAANTNNPEYPETVLSASQWNNTTADGYLISGSSYYDGGVPNADSGVSLNSARLFYDGTPTGSGLSAPGWGFSGSGVTY